MIRLAELRRNRPCPFHGRAAFSLAFQSLLMMGTPFLRDCYEDLLQNRRQSMPMIEGRAVPVAWLLGTVFPDNFIPSLKRNRGFAWSLRSFSNMYWDPLDPAQPMRAWLARCCRIRTSVP